MGDPFWQSSLNAEHCERYCMKFAAKYVHKLLKFNFYHSHTHRCRLYEIFSQICPQIVEFQLLSCPHTQMHRQWASYNLLDPSLVSWSKIGNLNMDLCIKSHFTSISSSRFYYAALLPRRAAYCVALCLSICLSVRPVIYRYRASRRAT